MSKNKTPKIEYKSENGYTGVLYGKSSFSIKDSEGNTVFHTGFRNIHSAEELKNEVDGFPVFLEYLRGIKDGSD